MSNPKHDHVIQGPLLIKIESCQKRARIRRCLAECNEQCPQKSYTIFDPKPPRRKSNSTETQEEDSGENNKSPSLISSLSHKEKYSGSPPTNSIHIEQEQNVISHIELITVKSATYQDPKKLENLEIENNLSLNIENNMARNTETRDSDQKITPNQTNSEEDKYLSLYSEPVMDKSEQCLCTSLSQDGQKRNISENTEYPRKMMKIANKNAIKFCNNRPMNLEQMAEFSSNPEYTIEISVELAQNKKPARNKPAHPDRKNKLENMPNSNEDLADADESYMKSPKIVAIQSEKKRNLIAKRKSSSDISDVVAQDKNYKNKKSKYPELDNSQRIDCPMKIAKMSDKRNITTRKPKSLNQPEEIDISMSTSHVEISDGQGNVQAILDNKKTKIRSIYSERDDDLPVGSPKTFADDSDRGRMKPAERKSVNAKRRAEDLPYSEYRPGRMDESPQYMDYSNEEADARRNAMPDSMQKKFISQNEQFPAKGSTYETADFDRAPNLHGEPRARTTKLSPDEDWNQAEKFSAISELEESDLYNTPEQRKTTIQSEPDEDIMKLFESMHATMKPSNRLSTDHDGQIDPDEWSLDDQDIVEKRRALFQRARALSAGLLEKARTLSAAAAAEQSASHGTEYEQVPFSRELPGEGHKMQQQPKFRSVGHSTSSPPMSLTTYIERGGRPTMNLPLESPQPGYQDYETLSNIEGDRDSKRGYRDSTRSAPPGIKSELDPNIQQLPKSRNTAASTTSSPPLSYTSFKDRWIESGQPNFQGDREGKQYPSLNSSLASSRYPSQRSALSSQKPEGYQRSGIPQTTTGIIRGPPSNKASVGEPSVASSRYASQRSALASPQPEGYQKSGFPSTTTEGGRGPLSNIASEREPSIASSRYASQRYADGSPQLDGYQKSGVPTTTTERGRGPTSNMASEGEPSIASSRYASQRSAVVSPQPEGYQKAGVPTTTTDRGRGPPSNIASEDQISVASSRPASQRYADGSPQLDGYQKSGVPSTATERGRGAPSNIASEDQISVASSRPASQRYADGSPQLDGYQKSGVPSTAIERGRGAPSDIESEDQISVASSRPASQRYADGSPQLGGYQKSGIPSTAAERGRGAPSNIGTEDQLSVASSRYAPQRSAVASPQPDGYQKSDRGRAPSERESAPQYKPGYRSFGASTFSPISIHAYEKEGMSRVSSPAASVQPMRYQESDVGKDRDSKSSYRPASSLAPSQVGGDQKTETARYPLSGIAVVPKNGRYPKNICTLETLVLQRHVDGCRLKKTTGVLCTIERLELIMPKYAIKGGDVILKCDHSVPPEQLHKVEWQKDGNKIFQYIKGRTPPFRFFKTSGAVLNTTYSSEKQMQLSKLDFSASGSYSCVVSMETPIFTKDSESKDLIIIEPQQANPTITFNKETYEIGEVLEANCTTAPARPPPHITWLINGEKVVDTLTKSFSNGLVHGKGYFEQKASSIKQLSIEVAELHIGDDNQLILTCMSTIPGYINANDNYADMKKQSTNIDIVVTEPEVNAAVSNENSSSSRITSNFKMASWISAILFSIQA